MFRKRITRFVAMSLVAASLAVAHQPTPAGADHDVTFITFEGGGFGHGVGMSQFGALGRAEAGHSAEQILSFYYDGTTLEDRTTELEALLGDGIRVRLSPAYQSLNRPDGVTVTARDPDHQLSVTFGDQTHTGNSIYLEQARQVTGNDNSITEGDEEWLWIVKVDGGEDVCVGCQASRATIVRPEGAIIDIVDDVGSQGAHDAGDVTLVGRDTAGPDVPDTVFVVLQLPIEDYLQGIDEVPSSWPTEALEAQAIAARSYAAAQAASRQHWSFDVFDSVQDQVYDGYEDANGNFIEYQSRLDAVLATAGQVVVYDGEIVRTFYSSSNGGYTAASEDSFVTAEPFHIAKPDPFDAAPDENGEPQNPFSFREFSYTREALSRWLARDNMDVGIVQTITINDEVPSGRVNDVTATIVGSDQTRTVSGSALRWAIVNGCNEDDGDTQYDFECDAYPRSSHLRVKETISFVDVEPGQFFYDAVTWMTAEDITQGTSSTEFSPFQIVSRAQTGTLIWRFMDRPQAAEPSVFDDVADGMYYTEAVDWMVERGVTSGTTATTFSPDQPVTRGQFATFLWRLVGRPVVDAENDFVDVAEGKFYTEAVAWMVFHRVTLGTTETTFSPYDPLTRGQIATFLWRLAATPEAFAEGVELPDKMRA